MPSSSFDMFFACTILVAAALIATAFLGSTMQARIADTQDANKVSYLKAIADRIVMNPGEPSDWGTSSGLPSDFGLATSGSIKAYEIDADKIARLSNQSLNMFSYPDLVNTAQLSNIALGVTLSQLGTLNVLQINNSTNGSNTSFTFQISASINSKPSDSILHCYISANGYLNTANGTTSSNGIGNISFQIPSAEVATAYLFVFARATFDDRITSFAVYNFAASSQELISNNSVFALDTVSHQIGLNQNSTKLENRSCYLFSYSSLQPLNFRQASNECSFPNTVNSSPIILSLWGLNNSLQIQQWVSYPLMPLKAGANFQGQEQNVFSYIVTVNDVLYRLDLSLGDLPS